MSLTPNPTSTEFPQTSLIPPGSFVQFPDFATKVQEVLNIVNPSDMEVIIQKKHEIQQFKSHLTALIEELKLSQKEYDFSDYADRLLYSDTEIENILETEIFRKNGELTELGKGFYEYLEVLTRGKSEELKTKMKKKLIKELKLEDRVYEKAGLVLKGNGKVGRIKFENKEHFFREIKQLRESGINSLDLSFNHLSNKLDASDFLELVKQAGESGIRSLNFGYNGLSNKLDASDFLELVKQAGGFGIKSLSFLVNGLSDKLEASDFLELVKQAGQSGIRILNLGINGISVKLDTPDFIELVKQAGESGIRSLNLFRNDLSEKLNDSQKQEIDNIAKQYNMQLNYSD